ncbi:undecaprenyl-diphosphate phosphatase [Ammoniphilus resinae]|uniref:Undecaprenyl-diphosphatase n=1 Tax=Ammoniphilus resinae TaxID=861532 RepID=A0ABS4GNA8_9BACL|nr:undecaprenyl-diphosphate phosphatase [Ammoniphilus resinae]MBP1931731.1 undecaprenyl-diphosphatase [Ammoniphilus resinae]
MEQFWIAIIMGIVEGLTEFLPVSSTGHMILTGHLLGFTDERAKTFEVVIQLGSISAVAILFWRRILSMLNWRKDSTGRPQMNLLHIILGMIPAVVVGLATRDLIKAYLFGPYTVVLSLIVGGIFMIFAEKFHSQTVSPTIDDISYKQAFGIGLFQCLALWPGFSRSGATIAGGLLLGTSHKAAAEFTFIMAIPIMAAASALDLYKSRDFLTIDDLSLFLTGFIAALIVAMFAIKIFLKILEKVKLTPFAYYRFILAIIFYLVFLR